MFNYDWDPKPSSDIKCIIYVTLTGVNIYTSDTGWINNLPTIEAALTCIREKSTITLPVQCVNQQ